MNKEEIQNIKESLELFPDNMNKEAQESYYKLFDFIDKLQQENKQLKDNWYKLKLWIDGIEKEEIYKRSIMFEINELEHNYELEILKGE